jgi:hypothetical protein
MYSCVLLPPMGLSHRKITVVFYFSKCSHTTYYADDDTLPNPLNSLTSITTLVYCAFTDCKYEGYGKLPTSYKNAVLVRRSMFLYIITHVVSPVF